MINNRLICSRFQANEGSGAFTVSDPEFRRWRYVWKCGDIMKRVKVIGLLFLCLILGTACSSQDNLPEGTGSQADRGENIPDTEEVTGQMTDQETAQEAEQAGDDEKYESVPYRLYPTSENAWVGDVMPMADGDVLQLYYLYDTDHNGMGYHPIYKFSTDNFYEYQDDGLVIDYGKSVDDPDLAIGTGSVLIAQDGTYHCFYTGHNDTFPEKGLDKECVMHAVSTDNVNWTKIPEDTFYAPEGYSGDDFRDPFVFWNEEEQCYWLLIAAREDTLGGVVAKYTSQDLSDWTVCDPLYAPQAQYMLECPDLFKMGDWYYLFYSWDCVTYYAMSRSINGPFVTPEHNVLDGTEFCFYAAKTAEVNGKRYLCGWVGRKSEEVDTGTYNWAGSLLIHQLVQKEDGTLGVREPESFQDYFVLEEAASAVDAVGTVQETSEGYRLSAEKGEVSLVNFGMRKPTMMLEFDVTFSTGGYAGITFGERDEYGKYTGVVLDTENQSIHYEGCVLSRIQYVEPLITTDFDFELGKTYHVKAVMENEIVVLYVDDTKALSNRIYRSIGGANFGIYTSGADVLFENVRIHTP